MTRWKINNKDAAAIFGALYKGSIKEDALDKTHSALINNWLLTHPSLEQKYNGPNFHRNFICNFRHVVDRFNKWKQDPSKYHYYCWRFDCRGCFLHDFYVLNNASLRGFLFQGAEELPLRFLQLAGIDVANRNDKVETSGKEDTRVVRLFGLYFPFSFLPTLTYTQSSKFSTKKLQQLTFTKVNITITHIEGQAISTLMFSNANITINHFEGPVISPVFNTQ